MSEVQYQVDLTSCDREPIHQLGHIQRFGALIAVTSDWIVAFRSANLPEILDPRLEVAIGDRLSEQFSEKAMETLREYAGRTRELNEPVRIFGLDLLRDERLFDVAVHVSGDYIVIEIEQVDKVAPSPMTGVLRPMMAKLERAGSTKDLCVEAAKQLKDLLGFDRVMVYRFHSDESGEVVAEARESHLEPFLNLRYPKTDIPQQARRLYLRNLFRIISDVNEEPVPIEPGFNMDGQPLDLSLSTLRAVSPIHIEYLQNMGVEASLSISIVIKGKLWGLFACHHYSPCVLSFPRRTLAELFSQLFSLQLEMSMMTAGGEIKEKARTLHDRLMSQLIGGGTLAGNLGVMESALADMIPHDGISAYVNGEYTTRGHAPDEEQFLSLVPSLNTSTTSQVVHSDSLAERIPAAESFTDKAVGAMIIPVSRRPRDYIVLWRRELTQSVTWAGIPEKVATVGPNGDRLTPRKSFAAWQQSVSGRSAPWTEEEVTIAENLRVTLLEVILRITDEQVQERTRAQERQELLIAELNHRVRNILTLIRSLIGQSKGEAKSMEQFADIVGGRIHALSRAHDQITREQWNSASLKSLIMAEAEAYLDKKADRVRVSGHDALVNPEAFTVLALVMHELMTNSAKYGSLCDSSGHLDIELDFDRHTDLQIHWRERGGPPVQAPKRRGFGSTIIEKSIPFELKGQADLRYNLSGLEADFVIPSRYVEKHDNGDAAAEEEAPAKVAHSSDSLTVGQQREGVLLVEDSMIIAMDAEEMLEDQGFKKIVTAASVAQALEELEKFEPLFALLDYNLGDETSENIAKTLSDRGIPFWFATGYGDAIEKLSESAANGVLQKPYSSDDLAKISKALSKD